MARLNRVVQLVTHEPYGPDDNSNHAIVAVLAFDGEDVCCDPNATRSMVSCTGLYLVQLVCIYSKHWRTRHKRLIHRENDAICGALQGLPETVGRNHDACSNYFAKPWDSLIMGMGPLPPEAETIADIVTVAIITGIKVINAMGRWRNGGKESGWALETSQRHIVAWSAASNVCCGQRSTSSKINWD
jgi:hypothetical protein